LSHLHLKIRFEHILIVLILFTSIYTALTPPSSLINWYSSDDAFYYFKTAQNITEGHGVTFDRLGRDSGFHPLWMLICIPIFALARFDLILPLRLLVIVSGIINAATAVILFRLLVRYLSREAAMLLSMVWAFIPHIQSVTAQMGMESTINAFFVVLLIYQVSGLNAGSDDEKPGYRNILLLGLIAALTLLSRLDNLFLVAMVGLWFIFRKSQLRYLIPLHVTMIIVSVIASYYIRLKPGAEYYQYSGSVYFMIAAALLIKLVVFYYSGQYQNPPSLAVKPMGYRPIIREITRLILSVLISSAFLSLVMLGLQEIGVFSGFPRTVLIYDAVITLVGLTASRLLHFLSVKHAVVPIKFTWKKWLTEASLFAAPIALLLGSYLLWNLVYFGTPAPVSGQIKHWWGSLPNPIYGQPGNSLPSFFGFPEKGNGPWSLGIELVGAPLKTYAEKAGLPDDASGIVAIKWTVWALIFSAGGFLMLSNWQRFRKFFGEIAIFPLFAGCLLQVISYFGTGYINTRPWYWVIEMLLIILFTALLADALIEKIRPVVKKTYILPAIVGLIGITLFIRYNAETIDYIPMKVEPGKEQVYLWGAQGLEQATEPGSMIGSTGGGVIAYFIKDRTIVNLDGLMNNYTYFKGLQDGTASKYLDSIGLDYVYGSKYMLTNSDPYMGLFGGRLEFKQDIFGSGLYHYLAGK
jgi:predicted small integral membrane protein